MVGGEKEEGVVGEVGNEGRIVPGAPSRSYHK